MQFKLGKRVVKVAKCIFRRVRIRPGNRNHLHHQRLGAPPSRNPVTKLLTWGRKLKSLCLNGSGYIPIGSDLSCDKVSLPPKGHLAVYVGDEDGDFRRVLVPVIFFNHPLFGDLLKDAEEEFGFQHPRGITIPCRYTEFQRVTRIASGSGLRGKTRRLMWRLHC